MEKTKKEKLRGFYADLVSYILVNIILFIIWALFGGGPYWPIWVIIIWGAVLLVQGASIGFVMQAGFTLRILRGLRPLKSILPFLEEEWKETGLSETSKAVAAKLEEVGLESAKSASAVATKAASKTKEFAHNLEDKAVKARAHAMKKPAPLHKKPTSKKKTEASKTSKKTEAQKSSSVSKSKKVAKKSSPEKKPKKTSPAKK